jgi:hypothetical protein
VSAFPVSALKQVGESLKELDRLEKSEIGDTILCVIAIVDPNLVTTTEPGGTGPIEFFFR